MKNVIQKIKSGGLLMFLLTLVLSAFGIADAGAMCAVAPTYGNALLDGNGEILEKGEYSLTESLAMNAGNQEFISKHFVQDIVRVSPQKYGTWSIMTSQTHWKKREHTNDHIITIGRVQPLPVEIKVQTAVTSPTTATVAVDFGQANDFIGLHQTLYFKKTASIHGYKDDGATDDGYVLFCRVVSKDAGTGVPTLKPLNGLLSGSVKTLPSLPVGTIAYRGSRIGTETQTRTVPFGIEPTPTNYFVPKKIIEFGTTGWFDAATKNFRWDNNEIRKSALEEFILTEAPGFWFGKQGSARFTEYISNNNELAYFPEGLIPQAGRQHNTVGTFDIATLLAIKDKAFKDNSSSGMAVMAMGGAVSPIVQELIFNTPNLNYSTYKNGKLDIMFSQVQFVDNKRIIFVEDQSLDKVGLNDKFFVFDPDNTEVFSFDKTFIPITPDKERRDYSGFSYIDESINIIRDRETAVYGSL